MGRPLQYEYRSAPPGWCREAVQGLHRDRRAARTTAAGRAGEAAALGSAPGGGAGKRWTATAGGAGTEGRRGRPPPEGPVRRRL
jgi:hypothetical protein